MVWCASCWVIVQYLFQNTENFTLIKSKSRQIYIYNSFFWISTNFLKKCADEINVSWTYSVDSKIRNLRSQSLQVIEVTPCDNAWIFLSSRFNPNLAVRRQDDQTMKPLQHIYKLYIGLLSITGNPVIYGHICIPWIFEHLVWSVDPLHLLATPQAYKNITAEY